MSQNRVTQRTNIRSAEGTLTIGGCGLTSIIAQDWQMHYWKGSEVLDFWWYCGEGVFGGSSARLVKCSTTWIQLPTKRV